MLAAFGMESRFASSNMHLWSCEGKIKKYASALDVLKEFCQFRLPFYEERKQHMEQQLEKMVIELDNRYRFASMVADGELNVFRETRDRLEEKLRDELRFDPHPQKGGYSYLLSTSLSDLTKEKLDKLKKKRDSEWESLTVLKGKTASHLWKEDLDQLKNALAKAV